MQAFSVALRVSLAEAKRVQDAHVNITHEGPHPSPAPEAGAGVGAVGVGEEEDGSREGESLKEE